MRFNLILAGFVLLLITSCGQENKSTKSEGLVTDPHSFSMPDKVKTKHLDLDIAVDFESKTISGIATYDLERYSGDEVIFDTRMLSIHEVRLDNNEKADFVLDKEIPGKEYLGSKLSIKLKPDTRKVSIVYSTSQDAVALQWLDPEQTNGKTWPFLFTQGQAILTRSWIPIQDSPGIRISYKAKVKVPKPLLAVMSASNPTQKNAAGVYTFEMKNPIPAYLMALAVGDLEFISLGKRTGVYAEPQLIEKCGYEFADVEKILEASEQLYGPYRWDRYDILVLPPSFPFGGMENPMLTFATPTIIAGDRSLISLIAHELAHSWSGNLVTNASWNSFWLNEGFTVYFERRIVEKVYGKDFAAMEARLGYQDWMNEANAFGLDSPDTRLAVELQDRDPDDGMTDIPYEKGYAFLRYVEENTNRDSFDIFLKQYFNEFAFKPVTTEMFLEYFKENYLKKFPAFDPKIEEWIFKPGIPEMAKPPVSVKFDNLDRKIAEYRQGKISEKDLAADYASQEWVYLIRKLPDTLSEKQFNNFNQLYHWSKSGNNEIKAAWIEKASLTGHGKAIIADTEEFLNSVGRRKYLEPIYTALKTRGLEAEAKEIYSKARPLYHYVAVRTIDVLLNVKK